MYFTEDWVQNRPEVWLKLVHHLIGAECCILEIGSYEGRSTVWWIQNILTHPQARLICVDVWYNEEVRKRFENNIGETKEAYKVESIHSTSQKALSNFSKNRFDLVYIDGSHEGENVLLDALMSIKVVKIGGIIIFDDYMLVDNTLHATPRMAIDMFVQICNWRVEVIYSGYQFGIKRLQ